MLHSKGWRVRWEAGSVLMLLIHTISIISSYGLIINIIY